MYYIIIEAGIKLNNTLKNIAIWALIGFLIFLILDFFNANSRTSTVSNISYSEFLSQISKGSINSVKIAGNNIKGVYSDGSEFYTFSPGDPGLIDKLQTNNIEIVAAPPEESSPNCLMF